MELRHLRYFVAVAEEGSFTSAAEQRLFTSQPSLSRQIKDLEEEIGTPLIARGAHGITLTRAGEVFLDHARLILSRVSIARDAARRAAQTGKASFVIGFLSGYEPTLLAEVLCILRDELHETEVNFRSASSPELTQGLLLGKIDVAFLRPFDPPAELAFKTIAREPLLAILPATHTLAGKAELRLQDILGEKFIGVSRNAAPALRAAVDAFIAESGLTFASGPEADYLPMAMTLVVSTPGVTLIPGYAKRLLPQGVIGIPLLGSPLVDLAVGYNAANTSSLLLRFLSKLDDFIASGPVGPRQMTP
jgi:LysR family hca operon transcriptional activator